MHTVQESLCLQHARGTLAGLLTDMPNIETALRSEEAVLLTLCQQVRGGGAAIESLWQGSEKREVLRGLLLSNNRDVVATLALILDLERRG